MIPDHPVTFTNYARLRFNERLARSVPGSLSGSRKDFALSFFQAGDDEVHRAENGAQETIDSLDAADKVATLAEDLRGAGFAEPAIMEEDVVLVTETGEQFVK